MRRYLLAGISHDESFECSYLLGSFLFFRMSALAEAGGFDERFFMYPEDIDIIRRRIGPQRTHAAHTHHQHVPLLQQMGLVLRQRATYR